jgi:hypothetical protein
MKIVQAAKTEKTSERWKRQYLRQSGWGSVFLKDHRGSAQIIYDQIVAVEQSRVHNKLDKIDAIIGNTGWTHHSCSKCNTETRGPLVSLDVNGREYSDNLCASCLRQALTLLENAK